MQNFNRQRLRHFINWQVARYAAPISYNFLNLIRLPKDAKTRKTVFEKRMGNIDDAVPFFGRRFNKIYPLIMVTYTIMITSNFFDRIVNYLGNWSIFSYLSEAAEDLDGFDPSGVIILRKERSWLQQGHKVGELVIPLARIFYDESSDLESAKNSTVAVDKKSNASLNGDVDKLSGEDSLNGDGDKLSGEDISKKYKAVRTHQTPDEMKQDSSLNRISAESSNDAGETSASQSRVAAAWETMKTGFQSIKTSIEAKKFLPLRESNENTLKESPGTAKTESLDEIFDNLKRPARDRKKYSSGFDLDFDDYKMDIDKPNPR